MSSLLSFRFWNGIYKITWTNFATLRSWVNMCEDTALQITKEVIEYKGVNKAIHQIIR